MRIPRIYIEDTLATGMNCLLSAESVHHISTVLRMKTGQKVILFNGRGGYYDAVISRINKHDVEMDIGIHHARESESMLRITLAQGISRGEHMDYTLQKAVELGVQNIVPVLCEYTNIKLDDEKKIKRHQHWRKIIINACEQCGRNRIPVLAPVQEMETWIIEDTSELKLILHPSTRLQLGQLQTLPQNITLLAGPEGGFSEVEVARAETGGYQPVRLGPRILRTETAALAGITACQVLWGDLR